MVWITEGMLGNNQHVAAFSRLTIHFLPELGMLLPGSRTAGMVVGGRVRMRSAGRAAYPQGGNRLSLNN